MINKLGERMVILMRVVNMYGLSGNRLADELRGVIMTLQVLEIEFEFEYNEAVTEYTAVILEGKRFEV